MFFKRRLPLIVCFLTGVVLVVQYYVPNQASQDLFTEVNDWVIIVTGFASLLGLGSLLHVHWRKTRRREAGWGYSLVLFAAMAGMIVAGVASRGQAAPDPDSGVLPPFGWAYDYMMVPLQGTMFSILAFFVASVAFRAFRARSVESVLLLVAAVVLLFGRVALGQVAWEALMPEQVPGIGAVCDWIMGTLNASARRGILIGVGLGIVATSLKVILGMERAYLGGGE